ADQPTAAQVVEELRRLVGWVGGYVERLEGPAAARGGGFSRARAPAEASVAIGVFSYDRQAEEVASGFKGCSPQDALAGIDRRFHAAFQISQDYPGARALHANVGDEPSKRVKAQRTVGGKRQVVVAGVGA